MRNRVVRQPDNSKDDQSFGFAWWGWAVWGAYVLVVVVCLAFVYAALYFATEFMPLMERVLVLASVYAGLGIPAVAGLSQGINMFTPVTLDDKGLWILVFLRPRFIPWHDVQQLQYMRFPGHIVYVRYVSLAHWFVAAPFRQSFRLGLGQQHREELFWEIYRRSSRAQGHDIPVLGWTGGRRG